MIRRGVDTFTFFHAPIKIGFPTGHYACQWCKYCVNDPDYRYRKMCFITNEIIYDETGIGCRCPITGEVEDE